MIRPQPNLVIMAGGASSRMKKSLRDASISPEIAAGGQIFDTCCQIQGLKLNCR